MRTAIKVSGRPVVSSGTVVIDATDREVAFDLDGLVYLLKLFPSPFELPLRTEFVRRSRKHVDIEIHGKFPIFTATWKLTGIGYVDAGRIDLDLMILSQGDVPDCVRQVTFTFSIVEGVPMPAGVRTTD